MSIDLVPARRPAPWTVLIAVVLATGLPALGPGSAVARTGTPSGLLAAPRVFPLAPTPLETPPRLARKSLDFVPALMTGDQRPELVFAQRAIDRGMNAPPETPPQAMREVEIEGWKSPGRAAGYSLLVPGTGQLYTGHSYGYVYLGVEALALVGYATFTSKANDQRDEYYAYVGDPNQSTSRFSFERFAATADPTEVERLRQVYAKDKSEFYDTVTIEAKYASGWSDPNDRYDAQTTAEEAQKWYKRANNSIYVLIANHLVSAVEALNLARLNNVALRENLTLKIKVNPGLRHSSYGLTLTQRF